MHKIQKFFSRLTWIFDRPNRAHISCSKRCLIDRNMVKEGKRKSVSSASSEHEINKYEELLGRVERAEEALMAKQNAVVQEHVEVVLPCVLSITLSLAQLRSFHIINNN